MKHYIFRILKMAILLPLMPLFRLGDPSTSFRSFLMVSRDEGVTYEKVVDVKTTPDLGGPPESVDCTTLSDGVFVSKPGIQSMDSFEFLANYTVEDYTRVQELARTPLDWSVWYGGTGAGPTVVPTGDLGKWNFRGELVSWPVGTSVNAIRDMNLTINASTEPEFVLI